MGASECPGEARFDEAGRPTSQAEHMCKALTSIQCKNSEQTTPSAQASPRQPLTHTIPWSGHGHTTESNGGAPIRTRAPCPPGMYPHQPLLVREAPCLPLPLAAKMMSRQPAHSDRTRYIPEGSGAQVGVTAAYDYPASKHRRRCQWKAISQHHGSCRRKAKRLNGKPTGPTSTKKPKNRQAYHSVA